MTQDIRSRVADLSEQLHYHNYRYHVLHDPVITDGEYDRMFRDLQALEAEHPQFARADSPTQRVGSDLGGDFAKVEHPAPILSLANAFDEADLRNWEERNLRLLPTGSQLQVCLAAQARRPGDCNHLRRRRHDARGDPRQRCCGRRCHRQCQDDPYRAAADSA